MVRRPGFPPRDVLGQPTPERGAELLLFRGWR
jgi:hypothetical protein